MLVYKGHRERIDLKLHGCARLQIIHGLRLPKCCPWSASEKTHRRQVVHRLSGDGSAISKHAILAAFLLTLRVNIVVAAPGRLCVL